MKKKRIKHGIIAKPDLGTYGKIEYAILGTNCDRIKHFCSELVQRLSHLKISYLDANHSALKTPTEDSTFHLQYMDNIGFHHFEIRDSINTFQSKKYYNDSDLVLINGNHFEGQSQIVFLDEKKEKSLYKRRHQLKDVLFFIELDNAEYFPDFLNDEEQNFQNIEKVNIDDFDKILRLLKNKLNSRLPPINGLILAGGKSTRMGRDKGKIRLQGEESRIHFFNLMKKCCDETYISGRSDQADELKKYPFIEDRLLDMGPFGAIISAFMYNPNCAWLVVATDLYEIEENTFKQLISARNPTKIATAFLNNSTKFPDPLCTIWEPKSYAHILEFMRLGYSCPRKVLINSDVELVTPVNHSWLINVNTKEDLKKINIKN